MIDFEQWCTDFKTKVPVNGQKLTPNEKAFYCLQGVSYMIDQLVNVGFKDILGVGATILKMRRVRVVGVMLMNYARDIQN